MERLLYISQQTPGASHVDNIREACEAGCRWVQLRVKSGDVSAIAFDAKQVCDRYGAKLSINDHPVIARTVGAFGLHVGLQDMPVHEARRIVGDGCWLGGTANTLNDALMHADAGADYIGAGPFRFTVTKEKLSPILGIDGFRQLMKGIGGKLPVLAIGGILPEDIPALMSTGVQGIAVSGLITHAPDKKAMVAQIMELLKN
ncbi:thiamine phosphate synthase [Chitinophaga sp. GCM10012297]|uniref:Thiamine-phosphate synthase n=1 Tax=Chitinophaga chungangae TaxID=2821488 RepID=A0ABS3YE34_9BACT|nr:thiamine phosphate synthase [Chitinophaga chungangae]MBO9152946.1 thiamine phosphate synthase [Chitinophaga chungangae]